MLSIFQLFFFGSGSRCTQYEALSADGFSSLFSTLVVIPAISRISKMSRFTSFEGGQIKAHVHHKLRATDIAAIVTKEDRSHPSVQAVTKVMRRLLSHPCWHGGRQEVSVRARSTSRAVDRLILRDVMNHRGKHGSVTIQADDCDVVLWRQLNIHPVRH